MAVAIDLSKGDTVEFSGSSEEDINYAKSFWQSVQLEPPMESRLVSSDIKQRLKVAQSGTHSLTFPTIPETVLDEQQSEFFVRARTLQHMEEFRRLQELSQARDEDRALLHKRREEREKKELIRQKDKVKEPKVKEVVVEDMEKQADIEVVPEDPVVMRLLDKYKI